MTIWRKQKSAANARRWLVSARLASGLTQSEVADACGISRSSYQKYEYGERTPRKRVREQINSLLSVEHNRFDENPKPEIDIQCGRQAIVTKKTGGMNRADMAAVLSKGAKKAQHKNAAS